MTVIATDAVGDSVTAQITIVINDTVTLSGDTYLVTTITKAISSSAFSAARGTPGYTFSIVSVTRSSGTDTSTISINSSSGVVTASASAQAATYTIIVRVTDSRGDTEQATLTILVNDTVVISGATTLTTTYSRETSTTYTATGGTTASSGGVGSYTYSITSIARTTSPSGDTSTISINASTGVLTVPGTTQHDTYTIIIRATDSVSAYRQITLTLRVNESVTLSGGQASLITTEGKSYSSSAFSASKGTGSYTYRIALANDETTTVAGITISSSGVVTIADTYIVQNNAGTGIDTYSMVVIATDAVGDTTTSAITITINDTVVIQGGSNILTTYGRRDTSTAFTTLYGTPSMSWRIDSIVKSPNTSVTETSTNIRIGSSTGLVTTGATTPVGTYTVTIRVTDSRGDFETTTMQVRVNDSITVSGASTLTTTYSRDTLRVDFSQFWALLNTTLTPSSSALPIR
ncbi:MAG: cadherin repeat domain-containing protein [Actinobacteria bacterium]|nr:cadherin repeat domain-containing protein [Actinomycetota bacterium]